MTENKRFSIKRKDLKYAKILENGKDLTGYFFIAQAEFICDKWNELSEENEQLKKCIKEIDDAELHLKQIILKRIDDYIWEWEDEGTPVAQVLKELQNEIKGDVE